MKEVFICPLSGVQTDLPDCRKVTIRCMTCGWNPSVHRKRVEKLRRLAKMERLDLWGKER